MKNSRKTKSRLRIAAIFMSLALVFSLLPTSAFAEDENYGVNTDPVITEEQVVTEEPTVTEELNVTEEPEIAAEETIEAETVQAPEEGKTSDFILDTSISNWKHSAKVTMDDGTKIIVAIDDISITPGSKLRVKDVSAPGIITGGHGQIISGHLDYIFEFLDEKGAPMTSTFSYWVSIDGVNVTPNFNLYSSNGSSVSTIKGYSVSGTTLSPTSGLNGYPGNIPYTGTAQTIISGEFQPLDITLPEVGGEYSIEYILGNYNYFIEGNVKAGHTTGPVIVGGTYAGDPIGGYINPEAPDIENYKHEVSSYINEAATTVTTRNVLTNSDVPLYLGSAEIGKEWKVVSNWNEPMVETDNYYYTKQFVDFSEAMDAIEKQSAAIAKNAVTIDPTKTDEETYKIEGNELKFGNGGIFKLSYADLLSFKSIDFTGNYNGNIVYVVIEDEGNIVIPKANFAGNENEECDYEAMQVCNVVWLLPNADTVAAKELTGHIVAPNAAITLTGGHYEGCMIAKSLDASLAEGHNWVLKGPKPASVSVTPEINKSVIGTGAPVEDFEFKIEGVNPTELPKDYNDRAYAKDKGTATFDEITYTSAGEYKYIISEVESSNPTKGMSYSKEEITLTVKVKLNTSSNKLEIESKTYTSGNDTLDTITNNYTKPVTFTPKVEKYVDGTGAPASEEFEFEINGKDDTKLPDGYVNKTKTTAGNVANFQTIEYTKEGQYVYEIKENAPQNPTAGMSYSNERITLTVNVKPNKVTNNLEIESEIYTIGNENSNVITNRYKKQAPKPTSITPQIKKVVEGQGAPAGEEFEFVITGKDDTELPDGYNNEAKATAGSIAKFPKIEYTQDGQYVYEIKEKQPQNPTAGMDYSTETITLTVVVKLNKDTNELEVESETYTIGKDKSSTITNTYTKPGPDSVSYEFGVLKDVISVTYGIDAPDQKLYTFALAPHADTPDAPLPSGAAGNMKTVSITDKGFSGFGSITFTKADVYKYTISEVVPSDAQTNYFGFAFDQKVYTITVTVTENKETNKLEISSVTGADDITYAGVNYKGAKFTNEYDPIVYLEIPVTKIVSGPARTSSKAAEFTFTLTAETPGAPMPESKSTTITITDSKKAGFTETKNFDPIKYVEASRGQPWVYTITEKKGNADGFTYSEKVYRVEVTVTKADKNPYFLQTNTVYYEVNKDKLTPVKELTFTNTYTSSKDDNKDGKNPHTGISTNMPLWLGLMAISCTAALALEIDKRRR